MSIFKSILSLIIISVLGISLGVAQAANPIVVMKTNMGEVEIELFQTKAPKTVANFLKYVDSSFYNGTIFHRVIDSFMIQGGGFDKNMSEKPTNKPIVNEATNRIANENGTLAMARTNVVNSATSQFFINVNNNTFLNHRDTSTRGFGYAVFGKVVKGMPVVNKMKKVKTGNFKGHQNVPSALVIIESIARKKK